MKPKVLEIGAFDNPTFLRELRDDVLYMDYFSSDELLQMHSGNPRRRLQHIVGVDYVVKSSSFASHIDQSFDLIVANHVVEHVPDLVFWLRQVTGLLKRGGRIFLSVPDRRYTFDYFRPVSTATEMIRASEEGLEKPSVWQLVDHFYYHQKVDLNELWEGNPPKKFRPRFSLAEAWRRAQKSCSVYTDAHCWVFTPDSFRLCVEDLRSAELCELSVEFLEDTRPGLNEFHAIISPAA